MPILLVSLSITLKKKIMLQKNPSTNANLTAPYFNFYHANYGRNSNYKKILNHILRFMQTITIYFSVSSFKKDSSLHRVSNKDHVKPKKIIYEKD